MRHSYEPDLDQLSTPEKALAYLGAGSSADQIAQLQKTITLVADVAGPDSLKDRFEAAGLLRELGSDHHTIVSAILGGSTARHGVSLESIVDEVTASQMMLIKNVRWLNSFNVAGRADDKQGNSRQAERVRQLILVMVEDVRALLVKLAFRYCVSQLTMRALSPEILWRYMHHWLTDWVSHS